MNLPMGFMVNNGFVLKDFVQTPTIHPRVLTKERMKKHFIKHETHSSLCSIHSSSPCDAANKKAARFNLSILYL